jgi:RNA polymerase sigma factor (sigma-70 family)
MDMTTTQLVASAAGGDTAAWNALVDRYARLVWAVARSYRLSAADAADVSQTTWLRLVEKLDTIKDPERLAGWLATTAKREAIRTLRLVGREIPDFTVNENRPPGLEEWAGQTPEEVALLVGEHERLWRGFQSLSEACRTLLWFVAVAPLGSYAEVSAALDMPIGSIGPTRSRCLAQLRAYLTSEGEDKEPPPAAEARDHALPKGGVQFRIGIELDPGRDWPWTWPRDHSGSVLPVRMVMIADDALVEPPARLCVPQAGPRSVDFGITPLINGAIRLRVLVYNDTGSDFLEELAGIISRTDVPLLRIAKVG